VTDRVWVPRPSRGPTRCEREEQHAEERREARDEGEDVGAGDRAGGTEGDESARERERSDAGGGDGDALAGRARVRGLRVGGDPAVEGGRDGLVRSGGHREQRGCVAAAASADEPRVDEDEAADGEERVGVRARDGGEGGKRECGDSEEREPAEGADERVRTEPTDARVRRVGAGGVGEN
jgi:hypothetical protein